MDTQEEIRILKERVELLENVIADLAYSDRYIFQKNLQIQDGRYIQFALSEGSKIGTTSSQKFAFWGKTPIVQPSSGSQAAVSTTSATNSSPWGYSSQAQADGIITLLNQMRSDLVATGIIKGSA